MEPERMFHPTVPRRLLCLKDLENPVPVQGSSRALEARSEAGIRPQCHGLTLTSPAGWSRVTVGQTRQVSRRPGREAHNPRQTDVKVRIESPLPESPEFVVQRLANLANHPCLDFRCKRRLEQIGVYHGLIHVEAGDLASLERERPQSRRARQRPRIR